MDLRNLPKIEFDENGDYKPSPQKHARGGAGIGAHQGNKLPINKKPPRRPVPGYAASGTTGRFGTAGTHAMPSASGAPVAPGAPGTSGAPGALTIAKKKSKVPLIIAAALVLTMAGAGVAAAMILNKPPVKEETVIVESKTVNATVKANNIKIKGPQFDRGTVINDLEPATDLTGDDKDKFYRGTVDGVVVYVPKTEVRLSTEKDPDSWKGYATADAVVYAKGDLSGKDIQTLVLNDELTVIDTIGNLYYVRTADGFEGYIKAGSVAKEKIEDSEASSPEDSGYVPTYNYNGGYSYNGGGNSNSGGGGSSGGGGGSSTPAPSGGGTTSGDGDEVVMPIAFKFDPAKSFFGVETAFAVDASAAAAATGAPSRITSSSAKHSSSSAAGSAGAAGAGATDSASTTKNTGKILKGNCQSYFAILNRGDIVAVKKDELFDFKETDSQQSSASSSSAGVAGEDTSVKSENATAAGGSTSTTSPAASTGRLSNEELDELAQSAGAGAAGAGAAGAAGAGTAGTNSGASAGSASSGSGASSASQTTNMCTIIVNGNEAQIEEALLQLEDAKPYTAWVGFAQEGATLYSDYAMTIPATTLTAADKVQVIDAINGTLVVQFDGKIFYMGKTAVVKDQVAATEEPSAQDGASANTGGGQTYYNGGYNGGAGGSTGGSGGGGGSTGGGTSASAPSPAPSQPTTPSGGQEWTDPAM